VKEQYYSGDIQSSSTVFTIKGSQVAQTLIARGVVLGGAHFSVELYTHDGPNSQCVGCLKSGHIQEKCPTPRELRCSFCAKSHQTSEHKYDLMGCLSTKGNADLHSKTKARCANCGGNHFANSNICEYKKKAITIAWMECMRPAL
jgi:hypothetical protein